MNIAEYEKVQGFTYLEYCDYLQNKYGIGLCNYMTKSWNKNKKVSRTKDGLVVHHKHENEAILLSKPEYAQQHPYEWQSAENLIYCDYLEHLFLHILICENPHSDNEIVGIGGIIRFIVPELNDLYSGWKTNQQWQKNCHDLVLGDKDVYLILLKRLIVNCRDYPCFSINRLFSSCNEGFGLWSREKNASLYAEIKALC